MLIQILGIITAVILVGVLSLVIAHSIVLNFKQRNINKLDNMIMIHEDELRILSEFDLILEHNEFYQSKIKILNLKIARLKESIYRISIK